MARLSVQKRFEILKRDEFTCQYCGRRGGELEVDHVIPLCEGGTNEPENLKAACFECNRGKSGVPLNGNTDSSSMPVIKFAIHVCRDGSVDWVGEILERSCDYISCEIIDAVMANCGVWSLSGEVKIEPANEWRLFTDKSSALSAALRVNQCLRDQRSSYS